MSKLHFLNVDPGDCTIIEHNSGHVSIVDVCDGFTPEDIQRGLASYSNVEADWKKVLVKGANGNFRMKENLTNPVEYLSNLGLKNVFRFILTHPDMDHMDGLKALSDYASISNFWDSGVRKDKPDFGGSPYHEEDWDQYIKLVNGEDGVKSAIRLAGDRFQSANKNSDNESGGDGLYILAPDKELVKVYVVRTYWTEGLIN